MLTINQTVLLILAKEDKSEVNWSHVGWVLGSLCLGCVVAWLARYFLAQDRDAKEHEARSKDRLTLKVVVSVMMGGVVLKFLTFFSFQIWAYCIGLLIGIVVYRLIK